MLGIRLYPLGACKQVGETNNDHIIMYKYVIIFERHAQEGRNMILLEPLTNISHLDREEGFLRQWDLSCDLEKKKKKWQGGNEKKFSRSKWRGSTYEWTAFEKSLYQASSRQKVKWLWNKWEQGRKASGRPTALTGLIRISFLTPRTMESHQRVLGIRMRMIIVPFWKDTWLLWGPDWGVQSRRRKPSRKLLQEKRGTWMREYQCRWSHVGGFKRILGGEVDRTRWWVGYDVSRFQKWLPVVWLI